MAIMRFPVYRSTFEFGVKYDYIVLGHIAELKNNHMEYRTYVLDISNMKIKTLMSVIHELYHTIVRKETYLVEELMDIIQATPTSVFFMKNRQNVLNALMAEYHRNRFHSRVVRRLEDNYLHRKEASIRIQKQFRESMSNPHYFICRRRLLREFGEIQGV